MANFTTITWTTGAASPLGRNEALGAEVNGKLYVFGGYAGDPNNTPTRRADVYNPTNNAWSRISDLPVGISHAGVTEDGQNIYYAGGYPARTGGGQLFATKTMWSYNTTTDTYTSMPALPQARGGGALVLLGRNLHFFGGSDSSRLDSNSHWYLSLDNLQQGWTTAAPLPKAVNHLGSAVLGGKIYAVGGQTGQNESAIAQNSVYVWNPETNTWTAVKSLPTTRSHIAAATFVMGSRIIVAGGEPVPGSTTKKVTAFEPLSNSWTELSPLPLAQKSGVAKAIGNLIIYTTGSRTTTTFRGVPVN
jgi:N-acetylneuraminic acid mutarotase